MAQILVNLKDALRAAEGGDDDHKMKRYNGGWCKTVTQLDKSHDNGYSLVGDFVKKETVTAYQEVGLYLDCDIGGSRKNQVKYYTLFVLKTDGTVEVLESLNERAGRTSDWAIKLWPAVEQYFASIQEKEENTVLKPIKESYPVLTKLEQFVRGLTPTEISQLHSAFDEVPHLETIFFGSIAMEMKPEDYIHPSEGE